MNNILTEIEYDFDINTFEGKSRELWNRLNKLKPHGWSWMSFFKFMSKLNGTSLGHDHWPLKKDQDLIMFISSLLKTTPPLLLHEFETAVLVFLKLAPYMEPMVCGSHADCPPDHKCVDKMCVPF